MQKVAIQNNQFLLKFRTSLNSLMLCFGENARLSNFCLKKTGGEKGRAVNFITLRSCLSQKYGKIIVHTVKIITSEAQNYKISRRKISWGKAARQKLGRKEVSKRRIRDIFSVSDCRETHSPIFSKRKVSHFGENNTQKKMFEKVFRESLHVRSLTLCCFARPKFLKFRLQKTLVAIMITIFV